MTPPDTPGKARGEPRAPDAPTWSAPQAPLPPPGFGSSRPESTPAHTPIAGSEISSEASSQYAPAAPPSAPPASPTVWPTPTSWEAVPPHDAVPEARKPGCGCSGCLIVLAVAIIAISLAGAGVSFFRSSDGGSQGADISSAETGSEWSSDETASSRAAAAKIIALTSAPGRYGTVAVAGTRVVWSMTAGDGNEYDVFTADLADSKPAADPVATDPGWQYTVAANDTYVAWDSGTSEDWSGDVYLRRWSPKAATRRMDSSADAADQRVALSDRLLVWESAAGGEWDIRGQVLSNRKRIAVATGEGNQRYPRTAGDWVVWTDDSVDKGDVYARNWRTQEIVKVCAAPDYQGQPDVDGSIAVWVDNRTEGNDIRGYDLVNGKELIVCDEESYQWYPRVSAGFVVWADWRNYQSPDIYGKNLRTGREYFIAATSSKENAGHLDIDGDIVAWIDGDSVKAMRLPAKWRRD